MVAGKTGNLRRLSGTDGHIDEELEALRTKTTIGVLWKHLTSRNIEPRPDDPKFPLERRPGGIIDGDSVAIRHPQTLEHLDTTDEELIQLVLAWRQGRALVRWPFNTPLKGTALHHRQSATVVHGGGARNVFDPTDPDQMPHAPFSQLIEDVVSVLMDAEHSSAI